MAKIFKKRKLKYLLAAISLIGILFIGNKLREYSYSEVPNPGETNDEYSFAWLGISLLKEGKPIAWSGIPGYKITDYRRINVDGIFNGMPEKPDFPINSPWFDHPPLFGLITGGYAYLKGVNDFEDASVIIIRRPMLKIATITSILIFILGWKLYGLLAGLLASLLYSTIPLIVISSRLALAENGYLPLFLLSAIFISFYFDTEFCKVCYKKIIRYFSFILTIRNNTSFSSWMKNSHIHAVGMGEETTDFSPWSIIKNHLSVNSIRYLFFNLSLLFAGLSVLFKLSGLSIVIFLAIIVLIYTKDSKQRKSLLIKCFFAAVIPLVLFIIYGAFYDLEVFLNILRTNSNRFFGVGPEIIFTLINKSVVTKSFNDGWLLLGWISLLILAFTEWKKSFGSTLILSAFFAYLFIFLLFGSEPYGWYRIPFYPFLALAISRIISRLFLLGNIYLYGFLMMLPIGTALNRLIGVTDFQVYVPYFRGIAVFVFLLFMSGLVGKYKKLEMFKKGLMLAILVFAVWLSVKLIYFYNIDNWYLAV